MGKETLSERLNDIYGRLLARYGPQDWWPAQSPFEVMVGAVLTQSAAWGNAAKAIANLRAAGALSAAALRQIDETKLSRIIYPSGYYNAKAKKLKALAGWLGEYCGDDLIGLAKCSTPELRRRLLAVPGIGPETADSILLYAVGRPVFVIDAYTRRIADRLGPSPRGRSSYEDYQRLFTDNLPADAAMFNEFHALFVRLGKDACRRRPLCSGCCLEAVCRRAGVES